MTDAVFDLLASRLSGAGLGGVERDAPLGALTTYRVGGSSSLGLQVASEAELEAVRDAIDAVCPAGRTRATGGTAAGGVGRLRVLVVGKGSNLLVADAGFRGLALRLTGELAQIDLDGAGTDTAGTVGTADETPPVVRAGGGAGLPVLARRAVEAGLRGLEWAVGIPGSVGGALKMNAGGHGSDTASCLLRYRWLDLLGGGGGDAGPGGLRLGYRTSSLPDPHVVVWAEFRVRRGSREEGRAELSEIVRWRREHQPGGSNAGSVFVNPAGDSAGRLVDGAGLKGFRLGSARVSEKHANFIQADDGGSADDVLDLMLHVRRAVAANSGVTMRAEVKLVGFPPTRVAVLAEGAQGADCKGGAGFAEEEAG
ncbi:MAG: FAD-binding protein [Acidimicrobiales bacterium]